MCVDAGRRVTRTALARAAVVAGLGAALGMIGWAMERNLSARTPPAPVTRVAQAVPAAGRWWGDSLVAPRTARRPAAPSAARGGSSAVQTGQAPPPLLPLTRLSTELRTDPIGRRLVTTPSDIVTRWGGGPGTAAATIPVLDTILYSPDRKLAMIDGRIVQIGDTVAGAHVVDIMPTAVLLRDREGRPERLTLGGSR
jgi:hypothetical protein